MKPYEDPDNETGLRKVWSALDIAGTGKTVLQTLGAIVSPWIWWKVIRGIWTEIEVSRVARETGAAIFALISPAAWFRTGKSFFQWLELRRLGKGIATMPVSGARAGAGIMGTLISVSRPVFLFFVPLAFIAWLVMGGGGRTDPHLKVARGPAHPPANNSNEKLAKLLKMLDEKPTSASLHAKVATEYMSAGRYGDASKEFRDAYRIDQKNIDAIEGLHEIASRVNDVGKGLTLAKKAAEMQPKNADIQNRLGSSYARAGQLVDAVQAFDRAEKLQPDNVVTLLNDAAVHARLRKWDEAEKLCRQAITLKPEEELPQLLLADIQVRRGAVAQGVSTLEKAIASHPRSSYARQILGGVQLNSGNLSEAVKTYRAAQELSPDWPLPYLGSGIANLKKNVLPEAEKDFSTALKLRPDSVTAQLGMAGVYERKARPADAIKIYRSVLANKPNLLMPLNNLAYHLAEEGSNPEEAYTMARRAVLRYPGEKSVWDTAGFAAYRSGHIPEAIEYLTKAVALSPKNPTARYHLGKALLMAGKKDDGARALNESLKLGLSGPLQTDALSDLVAPLP